MGGAVTLTFSTGGLNPTEDEEYVWEMGYFLDLIPQICVGYDRAGN
jgi:hypothetical protein